MGTKLPYGRQIAFPALILLGVLVLAGCHAKPDVSGTWNGTLDFSSFVPAGAKVGKTTLRIVCHITKKSDGAYSGTAVSPDQSPEEVQMDTVTLKDDQFHFDILKLAAKFDGKLSSDGGEVTGTFTQLGKTLPLTLKKGT